MAASCGTTLVQAVRLPPTLNPAIRRSQTPSPSSGSTRSGRRASTSPAWRPRTRGGRWSCPATPATSTRYGWPQRTWHVGLLPPLAHRHLQHWWRASALQNPPASSFDGSRSCCHHEVAGLPLQCVELDFQYASEGIHRRWDAGFRITACAATPDQVLPLARLCSSCCTTDSLYPGIVSRVAFKPLML